MSSVFRYSRVLKVGQQHNNYIDIFIFQFVIYRVLQAIPRVEQRQSGPIQTVVCSVWALLICCELYCAFILELSHFLMSWENIFISAVIHVTCGKSVKAQNIWMTWPGSLFFVSYIHTKRIMLIWCVSFLLNSTVRCDYHATRRHVADTWP